MDVAFCLFVCFVAVISIGFVIAAPGAAPIPNEYYPIFGGGGGVGAEGGGSDEDSQSLQPCQSPNDIACFYQENDPRRNVAINTKKQDEPYRTHYRLRCSRAHKFDSLYNLAEDQSSAECKNAIDFSSLS